MKKVGIFTVLRLTLVIHTINTLTFLETSGISLNSTSRAELMQKLAARQADTSPKAPAYKPIPAPAP